MVSTTTEKALFIIVGLGIVTIAATPLFNIISGLQHRATTEEEFNKWANHIEYHVGLLEDDRSFVYDKPWWVPENVSMSQPGSYSILLARDDGDVHVEREIRCSNAPIRLTYEGPGPARGVNLSMYFDGLRIVIIFLELE